MVVAFGVAESPEGDSLYAYPARESLWSPNGVAKIMQGAKPVLPQVIGAGRPLILKLHLAVFIGGGCCQPLGTFRISIQGKFRAL